MLWESQILSICGVVLRAKECEPSLSVSYESDNMLDVCFRKRRIVFSQKNELSFLRIFAWCHEALS